MEVSKLFEEKYGYGIQITHREGYYPLKHFFFKNEKIREQWIEFLKYYKGGTI